MMVNLLKSVEAVGVFDIIWNGSQLKTWVYLIVMDWKQVEAVGVFEISVDWKQVETIGVFEVVVNWKSVEAMDLFNIVMDCTKDVNILCMCYRYVC